MEILAIDPGPEQSGWVTVDTVKGTILGADITPNFQLCQALEREQPDHLVIEMIANYGMVVGASVFETCVWIGQFKHAFAGSDQVAQAERITPMSRMEVKYALFGRTGSITNSVVRQRVIGFWGPRGTKKKPGPTYGLASHMYAALGLASAWMLTKQEPGARQWKL